MRMTTIEEACSLHARIGWQGLTKSEYLNEGDYYLVTGVDFNNGHIAFENCHYVTRDRYDQDSHIQLKVNDVLVTKDGTIGKVAIIDKPIDKPATLNSGVFVVRPKDTEQLLPQYLVFVLLSNHFNRFIEKIKVGCTIAHLNQEKFLHYEFPLPTIAEQKHIISLCQKMRSVIGLRQQELNKLDELVKSRFIEMFGDPNDTTRPSKNRHKIGELCDVTKLAGFEFTEYINYQDSGEIIMLRGLNCKQGKLILDNVKYIDRETSHKLPRSRLYKDDILMTYAGTIGDVAMVDEDDKYHLAPNVAKITITKKKLIDPVFLVHIFMYSHDYIMTFASQVAQASINMQKIRDFEYIIPNIESQNEFANFVAQVDKSKFAVQQALDQAQLLFDSLMQQYFG